MKSEDPKDLLDIGYSVGFTKFGGLAVLLYRSILLLSDPKDIKQGYEQITSIRERLKLLPDDPVHDLLQARRDKDREETEAALRKAQENFESKRREVRALKEALDQLQKDVARRERAAAAHSMRIEKMQNLNINPSPARIAKHLAYRDISEAIDFATRRNPK